VKVSLGAAWFGTALLLLGLFVGVLYLTAIGFGIIVAGLIGALLSGRDW
jgi:hypothetical protein